MDNEKNDIKNTGSVFNEILEPKNGESIKTEKQINLFILLISVLKINIEIKIMPSIGSNIKRKSGLNLDITPLNR